MDRRAFLILAVSASACGRHEAPRSGTAQTVPAGKVPRVSILVFGSPDATATAPTTAASLVRDRLKQLAYVDGKTILVDEHYAHGDPQRLSELARQIVAGKPDVIVAIPAAAAIAARKATDTIPIVMAHVGDPVGAGLVASYARPGGNVTGTTSMAPDLGLKQIEILRELIPRLAKLGVLVNPTNPGAPLFLAGVKEGAQQLGVDLVVAEVTRAEDFDRALATLREARLDALLVMIEPMIYLNRGRILQFAAAHRVPASYDVGRQVVREGGLISFGPVLASHYALVAEYVDKILKGARPGELPVQQPTQFALVVNMKTANALGLKVPPSLLTRADEVIQ